jgi:RNA polymerase sigma-70 factor (ECF subfamily)
VPAMPFRELDDAPSPIPAPRDPRADWVARHARGAWRFARLLGCPAQLADDLAQDALLAALHKGIDTRPDGEAAPWLRAAVRNLWRMHLRTQRRRPAHVELAQAEAAVARHGGDDGSGDASVAALRRCVAALDGRARLALDLRCRDDAPRAVMAARLQLTEDGVKTLLRRTRDALFACVQRRLATEHDA